MSKEQLNSKTFSDFEEFKIPTYEEWEKTALTSLKGKPLDKLYSMTEEGIKIKPVYTKSDIKNIPIQIFTDNQIDNSWEISQEIYASSIEDAINIVQDAVKNGQSSINIQIKSNDKPQGVPIRNKKELLNLLEIIPLDTCKLFINTRLNQSSFISSLISFQEKNNIVIKGVVASDPIAEWILKGQLPSSLSSYYDEMTAVIKGLKSSNSSIQSILIQSQPFHNGGANAVQELAYTLTVAIEYVRQCLERGLTIDEIASHCVFSFSIGSNLFIEIAKLRAAKYLWASIVKEFGGSSESQKMWIHARTSATTKTKYDPYVNMLRSTVESFAAIMGGVKSIHTSAFDEVLETPNPFSDRIARNVQSILMEEAHLNRVADPSKGSFYVEKLTNELAEKAWEHLQLIEGKGGIICALRENFVQKEISNTRNARLEKIDVRQDKIVGTNTYANPNEVELMPIEKRVFTTSSNLSIPLTKLQLSSLQADYISRINDELNKGTMFDCIQESLIEQPHELSIEPILPIRWSMRIESLRGRAEKYYRKTGEKLSVYLLNLGENSTHKPRTDFIKDFFEVGGFQVFQSNSFITFEKLEEGIKGLNQQIFVICGPDDMYSEFGLEVVDLVRKTYPSSHLFIAGKILSPLLKEYRNAGLNDCIHMETNCYQFLEKLQKEMEGLHEKA